MENAFTFVLIFLGFVELTFSTWSKCSPKSDLRTNNDYKIKKSNYGGLIQFSKLQLYNGLTILNVVFLGFMQQLSRCSSILMFLLSTYVSFGDIAYSSFLCNKLVRNSLKTSLLLCAVKKEAWLLSNFFLDYVTYNTD
jgi:uncharacterized membrane protein YwzB